MSLALPVSFARLTFEFRVSRAALLGALLRGRGGQQTCAGDVMSPRSAVQVFSALSVHLNHQGLGQNSGSAPTGLVMDAAGPQVEFEWQGKRHHLALRSKPG